jgi:putative methyltransferase
MKNLYLFQPQQTFEYNNRKSYWLPYSVGCLWSYASQTTEVRNGYHLNDIIFKRGRVEDVISNIINPDVAVFSCYVWNWEYNREVAKAIKHRWPNCFIVFGGPQVTNRPLETRFFKNNPFVDTIVNGEGEVAFTEILIDLLHNRQPKKVITFTRLTTLNYPSPYTSGLFDKIIKDNPNVGWQVVLETNRGCPYQCTFCDWGSLTYSKILKFEEQRVLDELKWFSDNQVEYLYIADANFGIFYDRDKKFAQYLNQLQITTGYPSVAVSNWAKNAREKIVDIAKIFFNNKNRGFTLSVQSMNDAVLNAIKRKNMDINDLESMLKLCTKEGISTYTELILGLPYETKESWRLNFSKLLAAGQHNHVDVWFCQLLENSELNSISQRQLHDIQTVNIPNFIISNNAITDDDLAIVEYENIVKSTRYMSFEDLIDSYMFSHIVLTYHYGGYTQVLSRFLEKHQNISYLDFYSTLEQSIKSNDGFLNKQYNQIKEYISNFLNQNYKSTDLKQFRDKDFHNALWGGLHEMSTSPDKVFDEIFKIIDKDFCQLDQQMFNGLCEFQVNAMYNYQLTYPYNKTFNYNFLDYVFNDTNKLLAEPCDIEFYYPFKWDNIEQFKEKSYVARRAKILMTRYKLVAEPS